jgi:hypothetical protein
MNANPKESFDIRCLRWAGLALSLFVAGSLITIGGAATEPAAAAMTAHQLGGHRDIPGKPCPTGEHTGQTPRADRDHAQNCTG